MKKPPVPNIMASYSDMYNKKGLNLTLIVVVIFVIGATIYYFNKKNKDEQ